ncbi:MAG: lytic transglycosylase domain-containing protein [Deltaproteobacteria bacterium]|nr:lytic transglycosylase domain-containing protein [Deltaproteobacteria bacterium]
MRLLPRPSKLPLLMALSGLAWLAVAAPSAPALAAPPADRSGEATAGAPSGRLAQGKHASGAPVDDDAALPADHEEDLARYDPKRPLTISARMAARCRASMPVIETAAERHLLDPWLLAAVAWVESGYSPGIVSRAGSLGLMQLQPVTSRVFGCRRPRDPQCGADAAAQFLRALLRKYKGDVVFALCAYHAGPARPTRSWKKSELPRNLHYATRVLEARARLERFGCDGRALTASPKTPTPRQTALADGD